MLFIMDTVHVQKQVLDVVGRRRQLAGHCLGGLSSKVRLAGSAALLYTSKGIVVHVDNKIIHSTTTFKGIAICASTTHACAARN